MGSGFLRWCALGVLTVLLVGCGTSFFYNRLDTFIRWELDNYVTLTEAQEATLHERLPIHLEWHRHEELPRYSAWLRELREQIGSGLDREALDEHVARVESFRDSLTRRMLDDVILFLSDLNEEQITELFDSLEEDNEEFSEEYAELAEPKLREKRRKEMSQWLKDWVGPLNQAQQERLARWNEAIQPTSAGHLRYYRDWQRALREALAYRKDGERFASRARELFLEPEKLYTPEHRARVDHNINAFREMLVDLSGMLTEKQRARLRERLDDYAQDFETLARAE